MGPLGLKSMGYKPGAAAWAGAGLQAFGSLYSAFSQAKSLKSQARELKKQAAATRERGIWDQVRFNEDTRRILSSQRATFGEAGVRLEGAPMDLMAATTAERVADRMMLARNTAMEVDSLLADARELRRAAHSSKISGAFNAFGSFL